MAITIREPVKNQDLCDLVWLGSLEEFGKGQVARYSLLSTPWTPTNNFVLFDNHDQVQTWSDTFALWKFEIENMYDTRVKVIFLLLIFEQSSPRSFYYHSSYTSVSNEPAMWEGKEGKEGKGLLAVHDVRVFKKLVCNSLKPTLLQKGVEQAE